MRQPTYYRQNKDNPRSIITVDLIWVGKALEPMNVDLPSIRAALNSGVVLENSIARFAKDRAALTQQQHTQPKTA